MNKILSKNLSKYKYICPYCGSAKISWWEETVYEKKYYMDNDGNQKRCYSNNYQADGSQGVVCDKCGEYCNWLNDDFKKWKNPKYTNKQFWDSKLGEFVNEL